MIIDMSMRGTLNNACSVWPAFAVGVSDCEPSQLTPVNPEPKFEEATSTRYVPDATPVKLKVPCVSVEVLATCPPAAEMRARRRLGSPSSPDWGVVMFEEGGEKSRQTTPETAPLATFGRCACWAPRVCSVAGTMPTIPRRMTPPGRTVVLLTRVLDAPECSP